MTMPMTVNASNMSLNLPSRRLTAAESNERDTQSSHSRSLGLRLLHLELWQPTTC